MSTVTPLPASETWGGRPPARAAAPAAAGRVPEYACVTGPWSPAPGMSRRSIGVPGDELLGQVPGETPVALPAAPTVRTCRVCRCTDKEGCEGGCEWITADLCSTCAPDGTCQVCPRPATQTVGRLRLCAVIDVEHSLAVDEDRRAALADA